MPIDQIVRVFTPAEIALFKSSIDVALGIIHSSTPSVSEADKKGLEGVKRERFEFLGSSASLGLTHAAKMPAEYNHLEHVISINLVTNLDDMARYIQPLIEEIKITSLVVQDQALKPGEMVLKTMLFQSKINVAFKAIYSALSLLYKRRPTPPPTV